jgi:hypothetical protein
VLAQYLIYDPDGMPGLQPWFDMPEAVPRTRARLATAGTDPVKLTIDDAGAVTGPLELVDLDTTYEG